MTEQQEPEHSPLGGSGAERWMNCPGSVALLPHIGILETSDEPEYRREGIAAHQIAERCLREALDTWELIGEKVYGGVEVDLEMANAAQVYLDEVRSRVTPTATMMVEKLIGGDPEKRPHPKFYGRVDCALYDTDVLTVIDYKHGEGIVVEPEWNAQMMYYAYGILLTRPHVRDDREVRLVIVQPRAFHVDGPVREWATTAGEIIHWGETELIPAMARTEMDDLLDPGPWCRFCPAKLVCPMLTSLFGAAMKADPKAIPNLTDDALGRSYQYTKAVEFYLKAMKDEAYNRMIHAKVLPGVKLVQKQAKRVWKVGAAEKAKALFGEDAVETDVKSPATLEKLSPAAAEFVKEEAYTPNTGLTVALESDKKQGVKVEKAEDVFGAAVAALPEATAS